MAKKNDGLVEYSKQRDATGSQDKWARLKMWKDPAGGRASAFNPLAGNNPISGSKGKAMKAKKGNGMDAPDGRSDMTYGDLNKDSDSTA